MQKAGLYHHQESGLYLATYRGYNPFTARWLNRDPIEENGGLNLYEYVGGNPITYVDIDGKNPTILIPVVAGGLALAALKGELMLGNLVKDAQRRREQGINDIIDGVPGAQDRYKKANEDFSKACGAMAAGANLATPPSGDLGNLVPLASEAGGFLGEYFNKDTKK